MNQNELYEIAFQLEPGQAIRISNADINECVLRDQPSMLFSAMSGAIKEEIDDFVKKISENWDIELTQDYLTLTWIMKKKEEVNYTLGKGRISFCGKGTEGSFAIVSLEDCIANFEE